jgi:uncharacterized protein (DUF58 family)
MPSSGLPAPPEQLLRKLEWKVLRRLDGRMQGDYRTLFHGVGLDFADVREYEAGDDVRHIDWNVTARMDTPFVREYLEDRSLTAWLLIDRTPSMSFGPQDRPKQQVLVEFAVMIARILTRGGNRIGAMLYNDGIERTIPPAGGRNQVLRLADALLAPSTPSGRATELGLLLSEAASRIRRRSLVIVLSDFISEPGWERPLALLAQHHELVTIRLVDRREAELPAIGLLVVEDPETGEQLTIDTSDPEFRSRYRAAFMAREAELTAVATRAGVTLYRLSTESDLAVAIVRLVHHRKQRRR